MEKLDYQFKDGLAWITMDDGKANAMNPEFFKEMNALLDKVLADKAHVLIIRGANGFFSGGLDLNHLISLPIDGLIEFVEDFAKTMVRVLTLPLPTIAVCNGHTIAGGFMLAMCCDVRYIVKDAYKIQMNETINGIFLPHWMIEIGKLKIAPQWHNELFLHAKAYNPEEALNRGLFQGAIDVDADIATWIQPKIEEILKVNITAYARTKEYLVDEEAMQRSISLLKEEFQG